MSRLTNPGTMIVLAACASTGDIVAATDVAQECYVARITSAEPRIVLKARPTREQFADRLRAPWSEGIEVYLDARDIAAPDWHARLMAVVEEFPTPIGFTWLVEGPIRSLDGSYFDLTVDSDANREVVRRLVAFGRSVHAVSACVHLIAPTTTLVCPSRNEREGYLRRALPLARYYAETCDQAGLIPTVENIPPVSRMREGRVMTSLVGVLASDLISLASRVDGLRFTLDLSHAQLSVNAQRRTDPENGTDVETLVDSLASQCESADLLAFVETVHENVVVVHVADAVGLLGEGLRYGHGEAPLDAAIRRLLPRASYFVTEILEPDPDRSPSMREAEAHLRRLRAEVELLSGSPRHV